MDSERRAACVFFRLVEEWEEPVCEGGCCGITELRARDERRGDIA